MTDFTSPELAHGLLAWLLTYLLHSTILIGGIWCVLRLRLVRSAAIEDVLWKIGLVGALLTATLQTGAAIEPVLGTYALGPDAQRAEPADGAVIDADIALGVLSVEGTPPIRFAFREVPVPRTRQVQAASFLARGSVGVGTEPGSPPLRHPAVRSATEIDGRLPVVPSPGWQRSELQLAVPAQATTPLTLAAGPSDTGPWTGSVPSGWQTASPQESGRQSWLIRSWVAIAAGLWVVLAAFGLGRYLHLRRRLLKALGTRKPVKSVRMLNILGRLEHRAGISGAVQLTCSPFLSGPVALGRREICVPSRAVATLEPQQQEALLAHELAHIRRRDPQWLNLCAVLEALFFFQPLNRLARTRLQAVSEFLCDDWAVDSTGRRVTLAQCLAEVASWIEDTRDVLPVAGMARPDSSLLQRIRRIADRPPRQRVLHRSATTLIALALLGVVSCGVPGVTSGAGEGSMIEQLQMFVRTAFRALSPTATLQQASDPAPSVDPEPAEPAEPAAPAAPAAPQDASCPPAAAREGEAAPPAPAAPDARLEATGRAHAPRVAHPLPGSDQRSPFQRRLKRPVSVRRIAPPAAPAPDSAPAVDPSEPLSRFQHLFPSPTRPALIANPSAALFHLLTDDEDDDSIVLRIVDGKAVGVDSSGRTFRIVGVDQPGSSSEVRIELQDGQLRIIDGKGETVVVLPVADEPEPEEGFFQQLDLDRELRDIEREYESRMREFEGTLSEVQRAFDRAQGSLSREFETVVEQGQREYDAAIQEWTREFESGSEEMSRVHDQVFEEFERELRELQRAWADQPDALEEEIEQWEERLSEWEDEHEGAWEDWERSLEEELEGLEVEYEQWWEEIEGEFEGSFEELEAEYESGMEDWEFEIEGLETEFERAFAEWEDAYEGFTDSWSGRDCDHDCESACANGCTHPEDQAAPDCPDQVDENSPAEADAT